MTPPSPPLPFQYHSFSPFPPSLHLHHTYFTCSIPLPHLDPTAIHFSPNGSCYHLSYLPDSTTDSLCVSPYHLAAADSTFTCLRMLSFFIFSFVSLNLSSTCLYLPTSALPASAISWVSLDFRQCHT